MGREGARFPGSLGPLLRIWRGTYFADTSPPGRYGWGRGKAANTLLGDLSKPLLSEHPFLLSNGGG